MVLSEQTVTGVALAVRDSSLQTEHVETSSADTSFVSPSR
jgi:hypothetical protein